MDETALHDLAHVRHLDGRPVEDVLRRSRQLRRRRRRFQVLGATAVLAGLIGAGTLATRPDPASVKPAALPPLCPGPIGPAFESSPEIPLAEVPADLRLFPTVLPAGEEVTAVNAYRDLGRWCGIWPVLSLRADGGDDTVDSTVDLRGPFRDPVDLDLYGDTAAVEPTRLRGGEASRLAQEGDDRIHFTWTDEAGANWLLDGSAVDEATLRDVAEALELDATATPVASLSAEARPAGWEQTWQAPQLPPAEEERPGAIWWYVEMGDVSTGCSIRGRTGSPGEPPASADAAPGGRIVQVRGGEAIQEGRSWLTWQEPSGAVVELICMQGIDNLTEVAESLIPVAPDDPRLPSG